MTKMSISDIRVIEDEYHQIFLKHHNPDKGCISCLFGMECDEVRQIRTNRDEAWQIFQNGK